MLNIITHGATWGVLFSMIVAFPYLTTVNVAVALGLAFLVAKLFKLDTRKTVWGALAVLLIATMLPLGIGYHYELLGALAMGALCATFASRKGLSSIIWGAAGVLFGVFALVAFLFRAARSRRQEDKNVVV